MRSLSLLRAIAGIAALNGPLPLENAHPAQREFLGGKRRVDNGGRPKIHADRPKPKEKDRNYLRNRHSLLPIFLKQVWSVPKQKPTRKAERDQRIIDITARRFNVQPEQQFPLEAIIIMADRGVTKAKEQYAKLYQAARYNNISIRKAYDYFVLGKEV